MNYILPVLFFIYLLFAMNSYMKDFYREIKIKELKQVYGVNVKNESFTLGKCTLELRDVQLEDEILSQYTMRKLDQCIREVKK